MLVREWLCGSAMMLVLGLKQALMATIHQQRFTDLTVNETVAMMAVQDIENPDFWKCLYIILRAVFPALRLLCYCDKSKSAMDKIYYLSHRTTQALEQSELVLNDEALFGQITSDRNLGRAIDILGGVDNDEDKDNGVGTVTFANADSDDDDDDDDENDVLSFGRRFIWHWDKQKNKIEHEYAIAGWALCVIPKVRKDVAAWLTGTHCDAIRCLH